MKNEMYQIRIQTLKNIYDNLNELKKLHKKYGDEFYKDSKKRYMKDLKRVGIIDGYGDLNKRLYEDVPFEYPETHLTEEDLNAI